MTIETWVAVVMFVFIAACGFVGITGWLRDANRLEIERHKTALLKEHNAQCREEIARLKSKIDVLELDKS